jgi:hypothetical protein
MWRDGVSPSDTTENIRRIIQLQIVRTETNVCKLSFWGCISTTYRGSSILYKMGTRGVSVSPSVHDVTVRSLLPHTALPSSGGDESPRQNKRTVHSITLDIYFLRLSPPMPYCVCCSRIPLMLYFNVDEGQSDYRLITLEHETYG